MTDRKSPPRVELLWFADGPNHEAARERVRAILAEVAPEAEFGYRRHDPEELPSTRGTNEDVMYGTIARLRVKPDPIEALQRDHRTARRPRLPAVRAQTSSPWG